jgi:hypothetical protein
MNKKEDILRKPVQLIFISILAFLITYSFVNNWVHYLLKTNGVDSKDLIRMEQLLIASGTIYLVISIYKIKIWAINTFLIISVLFIINWTGSLISFPIQGKEIPYPTRFTIPILIIFCAITIWYLLSKKFRNFRQEYNEYLEKNKFNIEAHKAAKRLLK